MLPEARGWGSGGGGGGAGWGGGRGRSTLHLTAHSRSESKCLCPEFLGKRPRSEMLGTRAQPEDIGLGLEGPQ